MKFAHSFDDSLRKEEYPREWIDSAISYRQLKKCIKRVQEELRTLGLDSQTLELLWQHIGGAGISSKEQGDGCPASKPYKYSVSEDLKRFRPKLTVAIDNRDGSPVDAWLSPATREFLRGLAKSQRPATPRRSFVATGSFGESQLVDLAPQSVSSQAVPDSFIEGDLSEPGSPQDIETVEIPLTSDSEFFQVLERELLDLRRLQKVEQQHLNREIVKLGHDITAVASSSSKKSKAEVQAWREIFRLYLESQIFFSSHEQDAGARNAQQAQKQLQTFTQAITGPQLKSLKLDNSSKEALARFMQINKSLLQFVKFQEINQIALSKIMKKFDKRTALHAQETLPVVLSKAPFIAGNLAKAACFTISEELLAIIPQLDDYLCPVCFSVSFKPVRLQCNHVFCIRCLIVMQRKEQDHCPLCRARVVLEASSEHLDTKLAAFLKDKFPAEVKAKQRENERAAGVDRFGEGYDNDKCLVM